MQKLKILDRAILMATQAHAGQFDKAGLPYIFHPLRVAEAVEGEEAKVVAVLHDVVEDTDVTFEDVYEEFGHDITQAVLAITKLEKVDGKGAETYRDYLDRLRANPLAMRVKLADMADNSRPERLVHLSVEKQVRLAAKYARGRHYLLTGEWYDSKALDRVIKAGSNK